MTEREALKLALSTLNEVRSETFRLMRNGQTLYAEKKVWDTITAIKEVLAQPEQEPVAMKFKIYKPTVPDPTRQGINNALLPWVYDQDRSSGFDASMWVTPVATLPPQRKPLTDEDIEAMWPLRPTDSIIQFARAIEAAHGIKENT